VATVVHISSVHSPFDIRIYYKECISLNASGHSVFIVAPHERDEFIDGITILSVPKPENRFQRIVKTTYQTYRRTIGINANIYHIHDSELLPLAQFLRLKGKKIVFDMHENLPKSIKTKPWISRPLRTIISVLYSLLERILLYKIPVIFAELSYKNDYAFVVLHETICNFPIFENVATICVEKSQTPTVGYIGVVHYSRGILLILQALKILEERGVRANFECIGPINTELPSAINTIINSFKRQKVFVRGYMKPYEGLKIISSCHIGLAILKNTPNYVESFPTKIFEYMALGLPVIASDFPLYKNIVQEAGCGYCVNPENAIEVADAIDYLVTHPEEACGMGKKGKEAVKIKYNWNSEKIKLETFYQKLLNS
jgi:glycosyltransferase involved in cell wall biosynthesis